MDTRAAVIWDRGGEWSVEDITLDAPKSGEVLVQLAASGLCHSDEHVAKGDIQLPTEMAEQLGVQQFPLIGGHEGAGEVLEVGAGVTTLKPGDHVVFGFVPACGHCPSCSIGRQHVCDLGAYTLAGRQIGDLTARHHTKNGRDLGIMAGIGTFSPYTVASEASCIKIEDDLPLDKAALVGCGVTTGWGSAVYAADVRPGETVVVIGLGGIGMNALQGAALAGAQHIIGVDPVEFKREQAAIFGATHTASNTEEALALVGDLTWGTMAEKAILTVGLASGEMIAPMMALVSKGGRAVVTAVAPMTAMDVQLNLFELAMMRKELVGCIFGNANPRRDIPRLLHLYMDGALKLDELVTRTYPLDDINQGYRDMYDGINIRGLMIY